MHPCACGVTLEAPQYMHRQNGCHSCKYHVGLGCKTCVLVSEIYKYLDYWNEADKDLSHQRPEGS